MPTTARFASMLPAATGAGGRAADRVRTRLAARKPDQGREGPWFQLLLMLAVALVLAPVVRGVTIEVNHSVGRAWPFSLAHCRTTATPGCDTEAAYRTAGMVPAPAGRRAAWP